MLSFELKNRYENDQNLLFYVIRVLKHYIKNVTSYCYHYFAKNVTSYITHICY